jgi:hypothetical protein
VFRDIPSLDFRPNPAGAESNRERAKRWKKTMELQFRKAVVRAELSY